MGGPVISTVPPLGASEEVPMVVQGSSRSAPLVVTETETELIDITVEEGDRPNAAAVLREACNRRPYNPPEFPPQLTICTASAVSSPSQLPTMPLMSLPTISHTLLTCGQTANASKPGN